MSLKPSVGPQCVVTETVSTILVSLYVTENVGGASICVTETVSTFLVSLYVPETVGGTSIYVTETASTILVSLYVTEIVSGTSVLFVTKMPVRTLCLCMLNKLSTQPLYMNVLTTSMSFR